MVRSKLSRRSLLCGILAVSIVQLGLGVVTDRHACPVRDPEFAFREQQLRSLRSTYPDRRLVLFLGTSRTMLGLNAARLTHAGNDLHYNFGMPAAGPSRQLLTWRRLAANGIRPDVVAIEVLPALHTYEGQKLFEAQWSDPARLSYEEMRDLIPSYTQPLRGMLRWGLSRVAPLTKYSTTAYREFFASGDAYIAFSSEGIPSDEFGWRQGVSVHGWNATQRIQATQSLLRQYRKACMDSRPAPGEPLLEVLLEELKQAGVTTAVFTMPESQAFQQQAVNVAPAVERVEAICRRHGVRFVDLRQEMPDYAFYDAHHLHPESADAFTGTFARRVLRGESPSSPGWAFSPTSQVVSSTSD